MSKVRFRTSFLYLLMVSMALSKTGYCQQVPAQTKFDSVYYYIATAQSAKNIQLALNQADSLLQVSVDSLQKIRSRMLLATLKKRTGNFGEALNLAMAAEKLAGKIKNDEWRIRIAGFLSTTFRELGLLVEGKKYINIAESVNKANGNAPLMQLFIHQEKAYYYLAEHAYRPALTEMLQGLAVLQAATVTGKGNVIPAATCLQVAGYCYLQLGKQDSAAVYLQQALTLLANEESELKGFVYQNLGELALQQQQLPVAQTHLDSALAYATSSDNFNLRLNTYKSLQALYQATGNETGAVTYKSQYLDLMEQQSTLVKQVSNQLVEKADEALKRKTLDLNLLYLLSIILVAGLIVAVVYNRQLRKSERKKYLAYLDKMHTRTTTPAIPLFEGVTGEGENDITITYDANAAGVNLQEADQRKTLVIPKETETRLLNGLAQLEEGTTYLGKEITLPYIASLLKTNTKYLSAIINRNKGRDFSTYISEWRIHYMINRLQQQPEYQQYKIAHLAEACGFSSHSKFTTAFKNVTGISPSAFIENLKKDGRVKV